ncbi:hypothetical protein B7P43_G16940 [Cryptotermes secundus]|uniref:Uncharacterized protein n=1 Tax=Cryptotermes secundus TaxID=105785 RepID=A0A2J7PMI0_9NEOP|nr:hypothetical protein B7P43_G16940 [Cryptotermes secundus]
MKALSPWKEHHTLVNVCRKQLKKEISDKFSKEANWNRIHTLVFWAMTLVLLVGANILKEYTDVI